MGCQGWTVVIIIMLSAQVFLTTFVKNPYLLEYFDGVKIVSRVDQFSASLSESIDGLAKSYRVDGYDDVDDYAMLDDEVDDDDDDDNDEEDDDDDDDNRIAVSSKRSTNKNDDAAMEFQTTDKKKDGERQRIVILAGPHKTASTTLQDFFSTLSHQSVQVNVNTKLKKGESWYTPHSSNTEWVFPVGVRTEYGDSSSETLMTGSRMRTPQHIEKFYAILASFVSGRRIGMYFPEWKGNGGIWDENISEYREKVLDYFRTLMRPPWEEGKNIVIAAEAFDTVVESLVVQDNKGSRGEALHVADDSSLMLDLLLNIFPFDANDNDDSLKLEDFEVHVNFRTPRTTHLISIWHQLGKQTLRTFLCGQTVYNLYQINTLGLALQYVRKGIPVTILDMIGVREKEDRETEEESNRSLRTNSKFPRDWTVVGGLRGIVGCEILRMDDFCDDTSKLHLPDYEEREDRNVKGDKRDKNLTEGQLEEIGRLLDAYDCSVWQHLQKYREKGLLRILHPSEHLFETCHPGKDKDISFRDTLEQIRDISWQENGIPLGDKEKKKILKAKQKKNKQKNRDSRRESQILNRMDYLSNAPWYQND